MRLQGTEPGSKVDDLVFSARLGKLIVPAPEAGLILVDPETTKTTTISEVGPAYSADERDGVFAVADRDHDEVVIFASGAVVGRAHTGSTPDYVRFVAGTDELWVTEPAGPGMEIFRIREAGGPPESVGFVPLAAGAEGLAIDQTRGRAYTHGERGEVLVVDLASRRLVATWPIGCPRTHGIPALDERQGLLLAGCGSDGEGVVLDVTHGGRVVGRHRTGGGEALLAFSPTAGHFYLRGDPGRDIAVLRATGEQLDVVGTSRSPRNGHCLAADDRGQYWTCNRDDAALIRFGDRPPPSNSS